MLAFLFLWAQSNTPPIPTPDPATTHSLLEYSGVASIIAGGISMFGVHVFKPWLTEFYADRKHKREMEALGVANELAHANERIRHLERQDALRQEQVDSLQREVEMTRAETLRARAEAEAAKAEAARAKSEADALKSEVAGNKTRLEVVEEVQKDLAARSGEGVPIPPEILAAKPPGDRP